MIPNKYQNGQGPTHVALWILLDIVSAEEQDRRWYNPLKLDDLKITMELQGQVEPIMLRPNHLIPGRYIIVFGERRVRAARLAGWTHILAYVQDMTDLEASRLQWAENQGRVNLNPIEEGYAIRRRMELEGWDTDAEAARKLGWRENTLRDRLQLLKLIPQMQDMIALEHIAQQYGLAMANLDPERQWKALAFLRDMRRLHFPTFKAYCEALFVSQIQGVMWSDDELFIVAQACAANTSPTAKDLDAAFNALYPAHPDLPALPKARTVGAVIELYIDALRKSADPIKQEAARVISHLYRELRVANRIRA